MPKKLAPPVLPHLEFQNGKVLQSIKLLTGVITLVLSVVLSNLSFFGQNNIYHRYIYWRLTQANANVMVYILSSNQSQYCFMSFSSIFLLYCSLLQSDLELFLNFQVGLKSSSFDCFFDGLLFFYSL